MKKKLIIEFLILLVAALGIWAVFTIFPIFPDETDIQISVAKEEKLGKMIVDNIIIDNPAIRINKNKTLDSALNVIMLRLYEGMPETDFEYHIIVIDSPVINAAALPGGYILIYSGLIDLTDKPEELAAVIAHEIGHIEKRHIVYRLIQELGLSILFSGDSMVLGEVFKLTTTSAFSRKQEKEADKYSLELMEKAEIHPIVMATIFRKFKQKMYELPDQMDIISTHPNNNSRIKAALKYKVKKNFKSKEFDMDWNNIKFESGVSSVHD